MPSEHVRFTGALGARLAARLDLPEGGARAAAVFAHCFTCSKDLKAAGWLAQTLVEHALAVLRFDFAGIGASEGEFEQTNFSSNLDDLVAAAGYLRQRGLAPALLIGHSLGGAAVIAAAGRIAEARLVATIAAPADTGHFRATLERRVPGLADGAEGEITLGGTRFRITRQLLDDLDRHRLADSVAALPCPLLIFHSPADRTVAIAEGERLLELARQPKGFIALPGADHLLLSDPRDARLIGEIIAAWAARHLES